MVSCIPAQAATVRSKAVSWAKSIAADNTHGYSLTNRWGNPDYDCSSLAISAYKKAGADVNGATYTGDMVSKMVNGGDFKYYSSSSLNLSSGTSKLKKGDILWRSGHCEIYIGNGKKVGAHKDYSGSSGDPSGKEINITPYYSSYSWSGVIRYTGSSSTASTASTSSSSYKKGTYKVSVSSSLRVRSGAGTKYSVIGSIKNGKKVKVKKVSGSWGKITYNGKKGWISLKYCKRVSS